MSLTDRIKSYALTLGFDLVGVTPATPPPHGAAYTEWAAQGYAGEMTYLTRHPEKREDPRTLLPGAQSILLVAMNYHSPPSEVHAEPAPAGVVARYARGMDYHEVMKRKLEDLLAFVRTEARKPVQARIYVDTGPVLERDFAVRAGLGWYGKHTNLIHKRLGSWLLLGEILTDLELAYDRPATDHCGTCTRCIEACPTEAILAPYVLDARRCIAYLTIELKGSIPEARRAWIGNRIFGCDDCQEVCPWNRRAPVTGEAAFYPRPLTDSPSLIALLQLTPDAFRHHFKGSPIKRAKRRGLLRNVAVALGNSGDPGAVPALTDALADEEPLVRGHAAWALGRLGGTQARQALEQAKRREEEPDVIQEIDRALAGLLTEQQAHTDA
jgi:epoxyqueuosine reductase